MPTYARLVPPRPPRFDDLTDLELLLLRQDGVISRRQALRYLTPDAVRHRLAAGHWRVAERAVYLTHSGPVTDEQRWMIASLVGGAGRRAVLAGPTALTLAGFRGRLSRTVHVLLPWQRRDRNPPYWMVVHRTRHLPRAHVHRLAIPPYALPPRAMVDAAQWARTDDDAAAVVTACFQQRLVTRVEVDRVLEGMPAVRRRKLIAATVVEAAGGSHSLPEVEFLRGCRRARFPEPTRQAVRRDGQGRIRYLDALFEEYGVQVEIDGGQHTDIRHWWADMKRQNDVWIAGERILRFPAFVIRARPDEWIPQLRAALVAGGWRPPNE